MAGHIEIALLDRTEVQSQLRKHYLEIFGALKYQCKFYYFTDQNELLNHLENYLIHIFICDLSLGDSKNFRGLTLIQEVKTNWPQILCIGNTKTSVTYRQTNSKYPTFDIYVDKAKLISLDRRYLNQLIETFSKKFKMNTSIACSPKSQFINLVASHDDVHLKYLISQITFTGHPHLDMVKIDDILLTPLSGGRSGSDVYKMETYSSDSKSPTVPAVLKISQREKAEIEIDNYHRYVKWTLPYTWRVDILGTGFTKLLGGISYSFIRSSAHSFDSFTHYIENNDNNIINEVIDQVFSPNLKAWYTLVKDEQNINERYSKRYFHRGSMNTEQNRFMLHTQKCFGGIVQTDKIMIDDLEFPLPVEDLFGEPHGDYHSCICHGDLNSNNIIVAQNKEFIFIDFQDTGRGHVFEDFVTLEASIRLNFPQPDDLDPIEVLKCEMFLTQKNRVRSNSSELYNYIFKIRELAFQNFPMEEPRNYYYAVAAFNFRLLRLSNLNQHQILHILSALLANMSHYNSI